MAARIIDGKAIATELCSGIRQEVSALVAKYRRQPGLAVVLIGNDPASEVYVGSKVRQTEMVGMRSFEHRLPENTSEASLLGLISQLNTDDSVDGILVQLPLPAHINDQKIIEAIDPSKDVDGFHPMNVGKLMIGLPGLVACTPMGVLHLLKSVHSNLSGMNALVIGRSNIVGKPVAQLLLQQNATVTVAHSQTRDLPVICRMADIIIAAVGKPEFVRGDWIKPGATVIDVGINRLPAELKDEKRRLVGDVAFEEAKAIAGAITPVPGGVGPMTIAILLKNTLQAHNTRHAINVK